MKYETKSTPKETKPTDVASNSASANFRRARSKAPDLDASADSASATLKKSQYRPEAESASASSASLVLKRNREAEGKGIIAELAGQTDESVGFETFADANNLAKSTTQDVPHGIISTASVPKTSPIERVRRKVRSVRPVKANSSVKAGKPASSKATKTTNKSVKKPKGGKA